ncbi:hypothetical protein CCR95_08915 [Thiocystis minor]|uniref:host attachment protein n=1 Tax=Thiocystis minor TaxID=61597 RepID=UPI001914A47A|nr:host attachment protein [Thiocystis minor]MBK5964201.1 hypothetical protein [Thiocystis minor]
MKTWMLVASDARARLFEVANRNATLNEVLDLVNPENRLQGKDLKTDKPGRAFDSLGGHRHATQTPVDPKEQSSIRFAKRVVDELESRLHENRFEALNVVASPHFLGLLRGQMSDALMRAVKEEVAKDLTLEDAASLQVRVAQLF